MTAETIGIAVLGAGFIAEYHLAGIAAANELGGDGVVDARDDTMSALSGAQTSAPAAATTHTKVRAQVRVLAARSRERAAPLAARFGIPDVVTDFRAALDRPDVDAVVICTPDETHEAIAIAAAEAGKAVLLQKPMAGTVPACERIIAAAESAGVDLQVSFMHRYFPETQAALKLLADGAIGRVHSVRIRNATPGPDWGDWFFTMSGAPGGVVDQLGVHGIDLALQLVGDIRDVSARVSTLVPTRGLRDGRTIVVQTPDTAVASYGFTTGAIATHEMSMIEVKGCDRFRMELYGEEGTMWLRSERGPLAVYAPKMFGSEWHVPELPLLPFGALHHRTWLDGVANRAGRLRTAYEALRGMQVVEAIRQSSAAEGVAVTVREARAAGER